MSRQSGGNQLTGAGCWGRQKLLSVPSIQQSWQSPARPGGPQTDGQSYTKLSSPSGLPLHQACCILLRSEITPRALTSPGHGDPLGQKLQASADLGRAARGQGCTSQWQSCVQSNGPLANDECILYTSTMACPPAG